VEWSILHKTANPLKFDTFWILEIKVSDFKMKVSEFDSANGVWVFSVWKV